MNKLKILLIAAVMTLALTACIPTTFLVGNESSQQASRTYPTGMTYDWLWIGLHPDAAHHVAAETGSFLVNGRVCYDSTPVGRQTAIAWYQGHIEHRIDYDAGCTAWIPLGTLDQSFGWRPMISIGSGETFTVQLGVNFNGSVQPVEAPISARVATADQLTVWYDF